MTNYSTIRVFPLISCWIDGTIYIEVKKIKEDLIKLGITPQKTGKEVFCNIPQEYVYSYIRGIFDGDGSVGIYKSPRFEIVSANLKFLEDINNNLNHLCTIYRYSNIWSLTTHKILNLHHIYSLLYNSNGFYLQRKKDIFDKIITDFPIPIYSSQYTGVKLYQRKYIARIYNNHRNYHLGSYKTETEAAIAYNNKIDELGLDKRKNVIIWTNI